MRDDAARKRLAFVVVLISSNDERASKPCLDRVRVQLNKPKETHPGLPTFV